MMKIALWTMRAEDATTRDEALKALRKIAKHQRKLAKLQARAYHEGVRKGYPNDHLTTDL